MADDAKCACTTCQCRVRAATAVVRDGKLYCSTTCAYDCTPTTCLCVHAGCSR